VYKVNVHGWWRQPIEKKTYHIATVGKLRRNNMMSCAKGYSVGLDIYCTLEVDKDVLFILYLYI